MRKYCMNCKHCTLKKCAYENGFTNTCDFENRIKELSDAELLKRILTKECDWFEKGEPKISNELYYND